MSLIQYEEWNPKPEALAVLELASSICREYDAQGYDLTLRQLYYQFVARGHIPNNQRSYKRLGDIINKGRLAGYLDWDYIVDRTRNLQTVSHWGTPEEIIRSAAHSFRLDKWATQRTRVEVWVEKEALAGVIGQVAERHDCPWFSCRGYVSQSELWAAGQRMLDYEDAGQGCIILHLGDHDPSGIDMTRDIGARLRMFTNHGDVEVRRIALNMAQVEQYDPPPNPTKLTDSRSEDYMLRFGDESWELDALDPATLNALIESHIEEIVDDALMAEAVKEENSERNLLLAASERWSEVVDIIDSDNEATS